MYLTKLILINSQGMLYVLYTFRYDQPYHIPK